ncbi:MAG: DUF4436 family protein [Ilumatobacteraceae bacterium]
MSDADAVPDDDESVQRSALAFARSPKVLIPFVCLLVLGGAVLGMLFFFRGEESDKSADVDYFMQEEFDEGYVKITAHVIVVDLEEEHMVLDLEFEPFGRFDAGDGRLSVPLEAEVSSSHHDVLVFDEGRRMGPREVTLSFYEGEVQEYPFDEHSATFEMVVSEADGSGELAAVPVELDFLAYHHGYAFDDDFIESSSSGYVGYDVHVQRSSFVVGVATMWIVIVWALTAALLGILVGVVTNRIRATFSLFGYMTGFLLALFFVRELFPDIPSSVGVLSDFLSIFLAEAVAALVAIVVAVKWMNDLYSKEAAEPQDIG